MKNNNTLVDRYSLKQFTVARYNHPDEIADIQPLEYADNKDINRLVEICNQKQIYDLLFKEKLQGEPYTEVNAKSFVEWAKKGWENNEYFVFIIRNSSNKIIGAIDIKTSTIEEAEIGYWMDENSPGYMTNVLVGLMKIAKKAGYKSLVGYTRKENDKSKAVLLRAGFEYIGDEDRKNKGVIYNTFKTSL